MSTQSVFVQRTLRRAVLIPVIGAVIVAVVFLAIIELLLSETERLRHTDEVIATAEQIRQLALDMETGVRGYLLSRDRRFLEPYDRATRAFPALLRSLENLVRDNPQQARRVRSIAADIAEWQQFADHSLRSETAERELLVGKLLMDRIRADHDQFLAVERALSVERDQQVRQTTIIAIGITVAGVVVAAIVLTLFIRRQLRSISTGYEAALTAAEQSATAKDRMLATVSHELRTPLTSILGWATLIRSQAIDPEMAQAGLSSIEQSARLQSRLVEDLIDVSRAATGKLRVDLQNLDLRSVLETTLETMKPAAEAKGVALAASMGEEDLTILGDAARLQQVFWNLLSNSVRFTPSGGKVELTARTSDSSVIVRVRDTGVGIERDFLPYVFEPFAQQTESSKSRMGLGLGLAIARRLVELHGGTIEAASEGPGHGAEFTVRLPLQRLVIPSREDGEESPA